MNFGTPGTLFTQKQHYYGHKSPAGGIIALTGLFYFFFFNHALEIFPPPPSSP